MKIISWNIDPALKKELNEHYQAKRAHEARTEDPFQIIQEYTFSYGAPQLTLEKATAFIDFVEKIIGKKISGVGLEVGAGPGTHAALLANRPLVSKIYAVEASENIVRELMPVVVPHILKEKKDKVVGVVGDFSKLELPNESIDFVFDFFSLHHTPDLRRTLSEIYRVLKPGGFIFCFDKARDDKLNDADLNQLLDTEYDNSFKEKMGIPNSQKHTRRMNGENEYRRKDWLRFFKEVGFSKNKHFNIAKTLSRNPLVASLKKLFSFLPFHLQVFFTNLLHVYPTNNISSDSRIYSSLINFYQKEISLLIGYK